MQGGATCATQPGRTTFPYLAPPNAQLQTVADSVDLPASVERVWALIGAFGGTWHPLIAKIRLNGTGIGQLRRMSNPRQDDHRTARGDGSGAAVLSLWRCHRNSGLELHRLLGRQGRNWLLARLRARADQGKPRVHHHRRPASGMHGPRLLGFHVHDVAFPGHDHRAPGTGTIDFAALKPMVKPEHIKVFELSPSMPWKTWCKGVAHIHQLWGAA